MEINLTFKQEVHGLNRSPSNNIHNKISFVEKYTKFRYQKKNSIDLE